MMNFDDPRYEWFTDGVTQRLRVDGFPSEYWVRPTNDEVYLPLGVVRTNDFWRAMWALASPLLRPLDASTVGIWLELRATEIIFRVASSSFLATVRTPWAQHASVTPGFFARLFVLDVPEFTPGEDSSCELSFGAGVSDQLKTAMLFENTAGGDRLGISADFSAKLHLAPISVAVQANASFWLDPMMELARRIDGEAVLDFADGQLTARTDAGIVGTIPVGMSCPPFRLAASGADLIAAIGVMSSAGLDTPAVCSVHDDGVVSITRVNADGSGTLDGLQYAFVQPGYAYPLVSMASQFDSTE